MICPCIPINVSEKSNSVSEEDYTLVEIVEEWLNETEQEGEQLALRRLLIRQLTRRFGFMPTYIGVRTAQASLEQLETWLVRFVDAASLQAVFSEGEDTC